MKIKLDWLKEDQREFLSQGYLQEGQTPEQRYEEIANTIENYCLKMSDTVEAIEYSRGIGDRFRQYISNGWVSFATPVLINFGKKENLPISCNKSILSDSLDDIYKGVHELGMLAKYGAGTSQNFSKIRPIGSDIASGGTSNSVIDWIELYADMMSKTNQNRARRGFLTAYLSVEHPEIMDFLDIGTHRLHTDKQRFLQTITTAVTLPIGWLKSLKEGDKEKRKIWAKVLKTRKEVGFPYILDLENTNNARPQVYKDKAMYLETSNICLETHEYCDEEKTFACCLSSVNAYYFDEWSQDKNFIFDMNLMLDCVIEEYIEKAEKLSGLEKAVKFAKEHRSVGLGVLAFHSYLQKKGIVFGELDSYFTNNSIFSLLRRESDRSSKWMAENWGEPEIMKGYGFRNSTRLAQAPTKSTAYIMGGKSLNLSEGIEPHKSNYTSKKLAKIQSEVKNIELEKLLEEKGNNTKKVWTSILENNGSVQHLDFLTDREKAIFRTFSEISQVDVIKLGGQRAKHIDQGQSINIMIHPDTSAKDINKLHLMAFEEGLKGLYYQYSINAAQKFSQELLTCSACEG
ncbi:MAG: ribonucleotide-diphosphate reductase subunit alpha [Methylophaga sp.]|nr:ribonucleotide-diphosphate reductase subunit alpha [Methylophaga sp.]|tara:strand:+ start:90291 stop:92006 length:1716 start_codon:yes stop_codon:yes gene_type:complete